MKKKIKIFKIRSKNNSWFSITNTDLFTPKLLQYNGQFISSQYFHMNYTLKLKNTFVKRCSANLQILFFINLLFFWPYKKYSCQITKTCLCSELYMIQNILKSNSPISIIHFVNLLNKYD